MVGRSSCPIAAQPIFRGYVSRREGNLFILSLFSSRRGEFPYHPSLLIDDQLGVPFCRSRNSEHLRKKTTLTTLTITWCTYKQASFLQIDTEKKMHVQPILSHLFRAFNLKLGPPNRTWPFSSQSPSKQTLMFQSQDFDHWNHLLPKQIPRFLGIHVSLAIQMEVFSIRGSTQTSQAHAMDLATTQSQASKFCQKQKNVILTSATNIPDTCNHGAFTYRCIPKNKHQL